MYQVSELYIYPIKSLGGIKVNKAVVTDRGLQYDRRWVLIDSNNRFISQRDFAQMALLKTSISDKYLTVTDSSNSTSINIPLTIDNKDVINITIWDDTCSGMAVDNDIDAWFSNALGIDARLIYMPDDSRRLVEDKYNDGNQVTSFSDGFPFLLIGQSSLDELNSRLEVKLPMNRFRPNIVFTGGQPYFEDTINEFEINGIYFNGAKLCARCVMITINQDDAAAGKEPTKTLAGYRSKNKKIYFGQNLTHKSTGAISVGDALTVFSIHTDERFIIPIK